MAYTTENVYSTLNGNPPTAGQSLFGFTFPYIKRADVFVSLNGTTLAKTAYSFANDTTLQLDATTAATITTSTVVRLFRTTSLEELNAEFFSGSAIRATDLNDNFNQALFVTQEVSDRFVDVNSASFANNVSFNGNRIIDLGDGVDPTDAVTKQQLDATENYNDSQLAAQVSAAASHATTAQAGASAANNSAAAASGHSTNAQTSANSAANSAIAAANSATSAQASAAAAANFASESTFYGAKRATTTGNRIVLRLDYTEASNTTNVYDPLDYKYKGTNTAILTTNGLLHKSGANVGEPKFAFQSSGHVYIQLHD